MAHSLEGLLWSWYDRA